MLKRSYCIEKAMALAVKTGVFVVLALAMVVPLNAEEPVPGTGFASALELSPGTHSFYLELGEIHYFKVNLEAGDILSVKIRMPFNQDFDLYLFNPLREIVAQSVRAAGLTDAVELIVSETGFHYVVVAGFGGARGVYSLTLFVQKPKTVTQTVTQTVTEKITNTATVQVFMTNTVVSEKVVTVVDREVVEVERIPWTALGLVAVSAALLYMGYAASNTVKQVVKREETQPAKTEPATNQ